MDSERGEKQKHTSKEYSCKTCGKAFPTNGTLIIHERVHKPYGCEVCDKTFPAKSNLAQHKRIHNGEKPYECNICENTFTQSSSLIVHMRIHTGERPFACDTCEKTFSRRSTLVEHKIFHTGEKPFYCDLCKKSFSKRSYLSQHEKTPAHVKKMESKTKDSSPSNSNSFIGTKEYQDDLQSKQQQLSLLCYICGDKFNSLIELTIHKEIHLNDKSYSCDVCQTSYTTQSVLTLHNKTSAHLKRKESLNLSSSTSHTDFIDCGEVVKVEDIKEEIKEEEKSVDDPLSIQGETTLGVSENIVTGVKEEMIVDNPFNIQEIHKLGDGENNTVVDDIDIVQHKIKTDDF